MHKQASLTFVFVLMLLDVIGFGIVMPVLPQLIMELGSLTIGQAAIWAGWLGAGYAAMQFVFAPIIGNLSDRFGRRPVMLASTLAFGIDFLVMGFAPDLWWLVIGRALAGITGASYAAAFAYIADVTPPEKRAQSFGLAGVAFGVGFIIGPALGGLLGEYGARVPFFAAGGCALVNFVIGSGFLRESLPEDRRRPFRLARANAFSALKALSHQSAKVGWFVAALGAWQLSHLVYPAIWAFFAIAAYGWSEWQIGLSLMAIGISSAVVQSFGLRLLLPRLGETRAVMLGVVTVVLVSIAYASVRADWLIFIVLLFHGLQGLVMPSINALNSKAVDAHSQGELQGATQAIGSLAAIIGPPLYTAIFGFFVGPNAPFIFPAMPLLLAAGFALVALALFLYASRRFAPEAVAA